MLDDVDSKRADQPDGQHLDPKGRRKFRALGNVGAVRSPDLAQPIDSRGAHELAHGLDLGRVGLLPPRQRASAAERKGVATASRDRWQISTVVQARSAVVSALATGVPAWFAGKQMETVDRLAEQEVAVQRQESAIAAILTFSEPEIIGEVRRLRELAEKPLRQFGANEYEEIFEVELAALRRRKDAFVVCIGYAAQIRQGSMS